MANWFTGIVDNIGSAAGNAITTAEQAGMTKLQQSIGLATPSTVQTPTGQTVVNTAPASAAQPSFAQILANIPSMDWMALAIGAGVIGFIILHHKK